MRVFISGGLDIERSALTDHIAERIETPRLPLDVLLTDPYFSERGWVGEAPILTPDQSKFIAGCADVVVSMEPHKYRGNATDYLERSTSERQLRHDVTVANITLGRRPNERQVILLNDMKFWHALVQRLVTDSARRY